ncbi:hypothetical protein MesoLj113a_33260 [Mesorhizobium sp. 113-1-2]|nr:hypothetical protein MesoLj113a_33260 [Mesorhizobium sp. 113-1-2]
MIDLPHAKAKLGNGGAVIQRDLCGHGRVLCEEMSGRSPNAAYLGTRWDDDQSPWTNSRGSNFAALMSASGEPVHFGRRTARTTPVDVLPQ